ncbi:MAG: FecR domain-containing protein [Nitrospirae bacterium]|nr:FecR domain-containing protein [Nitrospirota bacterium]
MDNRLKIKYIFFVIAAAACLLYSRAEAAEAVGKFTSVEGRVDVLRGGELPSIAVNAGDVIYIKDTVRSKSSSTAQILFNDGNVLTIEQRSRINISEYYSDGSSDGVIGLSKGKINVVVAKDLLKDAGSTSGKKFEIHTPNAVAGVRGTCYSVAFSNLFTFVNSQGERKCSKPGNVYVYNINNVEYVVIVPPDGYGFVPGEGYPVVTNDPVFGDPAIAPPAGCNGAFCIALPLIDFPMNIRGKQGDFELLEKNPLPPSND